MKPVLIIKTGNTVASIPPERGDFEHWISAGMGLEALSCQVANVSAGAPLPAPEEVVGVVVTGSAAMVTDGLPWSEQTARWLRLAIDQAVPVLGICYGHQLLAHALGGAVDYHPEGREIGTKVVTLTPAARHDLLLAGMPESFQVNVSHKQTVTRLPPQAVVLAANSFESFHAVRFRERVWGLQFHPEFAGDVMKAYLQDRQLQLEAEGLDTAKLLEQVADTPLAESLLRQFARLLAAV
jgi:GMP synthase (glutamine-hydrolysing)